VENQNLYCEGHSQFEWLAFQQNSRNLFVYLCEFCVPRVSDLIISHTDRYFSHMPTVRRKHTHTWLANIWQGSLSIFASEDGEFGP